MIEQGCERVSTETTRPWRWWFIAIADTAKGRFMFARGGRATSEAACHVSLRQAREEASVERDELLRFRPTHALGPRGELVPIPKDPARSIEEADTEVPWPVRIGP